MRLMRLLAPAIALLVGAAVPPAGDSLKMGVQTHFSQNWPASLVPLVANARVAAVRDGAPWGMGEPSPGHYRFDIPGAATLQAICRAGGTVLLTIVPRHPRYDGGQTVSSPVGIAAYAAYAAALAGHYGACLAGIEVGNEINDPRNLPYPAGVDRAASYVALVRATRAAIKAAGGHAAVLGGSTNVIGTGFLDRLFAAGLLDAADAVAVHPYRSQAENVDVELAHLRLVMQSHGRVLPIWATEFSDNYQTPELAGDELVKMATLLSAAGVSHAYWYALIDQRWFRNMGLYDDRGHAKPAALALRQMAPLVIAARAERVNLGDAGIQLYRLGGSNYVLWGSGGGVAFAGSPTVRDARGTPVSLALGAVPVGAPLIIAGAGAPRLASPSGVVADTLFGYARAPWTYLARTPDGREHMLSITDWDWTSGYASRFFQPLRITDTVATVAGTGAAPTRAVLRYTAPIAQHLTVEGCFHKGGRGDGVDLAIEASGKTLWRSILTGDATAAGINVDLAAGQTLDLSAGPNQTAGGDVFYYRLTLFARGAGRAVPCPQHPYPVY